MLPLLPEGWGPEAAEGRCPGPQCPPLRERHGPGCTLGSTLWPTPGLRLPTPALPQARWLWRAGSPPPPPLFPLPRGSPVPQRGFPVPAAPPLPPGHGHPVQRPLLLSFLPAGSHWHTARGRKADPLPRSGPGHGMPLMCPVVSPQEGPGSAEFAPRTGSLSPRSPAPDLAAQPSARLTSHICEGAPRPARASEGSWFCSRCCGGSPRPQSAQPPRESQPSPRATPSKRRNTQGA